MSTKYFVTPSGAYIGGFDGADPPAEAIEVPVPPPRADYLWDGEKFISPPRDPAELQTEIVTATQQRLDDFARTRNYDGILSLCTYATSTVQKFKAEGQYGVTARDATWAKLYEMLAEVEAGTRPMPTGFEDIEPELPVLAWPQEPSV